MFKFVSKEILTIGDQKVSKINAFKEGLKNKEYQEKEFISVLKKLTEKKENEHTDLDIKLIELLTEQHKN